MLITLLLRLALAGPSFLFIDHDPSATVRDGHSRDCFRLTQTSSVCKIESEQARIEIDQPCGPPIVAVLHWNADGMMQTRLIERANPCVFRFPIVYGGYR